MWCHVIWWIGTIVTEEAAVSIFRAEDLVDGGQWVPLKWWLYPSCTVSHLRRQQSQPWELHISQESNIATLIPKNTVFWGVTACNMVVESMLSQHKMYCFGCKRFNKNTSRWLKYLCQAVGWYMCLISSNFPVLLFLWDHTVDISFRSGATFSVYDLLM